MPLVRQQAEPINMKEIHSLSQDELKRYISLEDLIKLSAEQDNIYPKRTKKVLRKLKILGVELCQGCVIPSCCQPPSCHPILNDCPTNDIIVGCIQNIDIQGVSIITKTNDEISINFEKMNGMQSIYSIKFGNHLSNTSSELIKFKTSEGTFDINLR